MNILEGKDIFLRALEPEDIDILYQWENDTDGWAVSNLFAPLSRYVLVEYLKTAHRDIFENKELRLVIALKDSGKAIGLIDLFNYDPYHNRAGVGILIAEIDDRGKGFASEALGLMVNYAFSILRLHSLYCDISETNVKSINLFENANFIQQGEKKDWLRTKDGYETEFFYQLFNEL